MIINVFQFIRGYQITSLDENSLHEFQQETLSGNYGELYNLAITSYKNGDYKKAITYFEESTIANPVFVDAHYGLGLSFEAIGRYDKAISEFKEVLNLDKTHADSYYHLGSIYEILGLNEKAVNYFESAVKYYPPENPWKEKAQKKHRQLYKEAS